VAERTYVCTPRNIQRLTVPDTIFAIGAFYTSFPSYEDDPHLHSKFFALAMLFASDVMSDCTFDNVCTLLAQCFYLLATCQMERYTLSCHCYFRSLHGHAEHGISLVLQFAWARVLDCMLKIHQRKMPVIRFNEKCDVELGILFTS